MGRRVGGGSLPDGRVGEGEEEAVLRQRVRSLGQVTELKRANDVRSTLGGSEEAERISITHHHHTLYRRTAKSICTCLLYRITDIFDISGFLDAREILNPPSGLGAYICLDAVTLGILSFHFQPFSLLSRTNYNYVVVSMCSIPVAFFSSYIFILFLYPFHHLYIFFFLFSLILK